MSRVKRYVKRDEEYEEVLITDPCAASEPRSEVDIDSSDVEPQESNSDNDRENENPADTSPKIKVTSIKCRVDNENKSEDGEMDDDNSFNNNSGAVNGEVSSSSSMEEGEIEDEEESRVAWKSQNYSENNKKSDELSSSLFCNKNIKSASFNLEVGKITNVRDNSPGWAWGEEEIGN